MRRPEWTRAKQSDLRRQESRDGMNRGDLERLVEVERRKNARRALRHHRLAGSGRTREQHVVAAGGGDLQRAACGHLSAHIGKVTVREVERFGRGVANDGYG